MVGKVVIVNTDEDDPFAAGVNEAGLKLHPTVALLVTQVNPTAELNPLSDVTVIVEVVEFPIEVATEIGDDVKLKSLIERLKVVKRV